jgi:hypothetical protein
MIARSDAPIVTSAATQVATAGPLVHIEDDDVPTQTARGSPSSSLA